MPPTGNGHLQEAGAPYPTSVEPEHQAILGVVLAWLVAVAMIGGYVLLQPPPPPPPAEVLPVPAGSVFTANATESWAAHFTVGTVGAVLSGGWTAYDGIGQITLVVVNATVSKPPPPVGPINCPDLFQWNEQAGYINTFLPAGPYTVYWGTVCAGASQIVVTQAIQLSSY